MMFPDRLSDTHETIDCHTGRDMSAIKQKMLTWRFILLQMRASWFFSWLSGLILAQRFSG
jgi:hypothetical protein